MFTSAPQEVVEEEVMRLKGRKSEKLFVSQAVNVFTQSVSAKGRRVPATKSGMIQTAPGGKPDATLGGIKMRFQVPTRQSG